ncbi:hypothetical protein RchiOBHm_Chr7g0200271 [Rosa chinensis]|uniref:Uncharacterized protein n=1 Tax=Rosa chinensis TaxID=74649 RepID=A0A2P6P7M8_ROSCH|nr:hypothetical protein RchiOBHm_Chr7g0200271 [Rosa chinensis]
MVVGERAGQKSPSARKNRPVCPGPGLARSPFSETTSPTRRKIAGPGPGPCKSSAGLGPCPALPLSNHRGTNEDGRKFYGVWRKIEGKGEEEGTREERGVFREIGVQCGFELATNSTWKFFIGTSHIHLVRRRRFPRIGSGFGPGGSFLEVFLALEIE